MRVRHALCDCKSSQIRVSTLVSRHLPLHKIAWRCPVWEGHAASSASHLDSMTCVVFAVAPTAAAKPDRPATRAPLRHDAPPRADRACLPPPLMPSLLSKRLRDASDCPDAGIAERGRAAMATRGAAAQVDPGL